MPSSMQFQIARYGSDKALSKGHDENSSHEADVSSIRSLAKMLPANRQTAFKDLICLLVMSVCFGVKYL
ncbi:hypothetical protein OESDEN_10261 [Oesophagostomum dentatum]|uniref:Uncharacterized protein n=1 Tax=Oesophagostomum dentatum TaxID=61180 RepID=A0A0B1SY40_OESDE|nr:hypothetical protein OESDEN_10261 [Oesophagostomum dentatum]